MAWMEPRERDAHRTRRSARAWLPVCTFVAGALSAATFSCNLGWPQTARVGVEAAQAETAQGAATSSSTPPGILLPSGHSIADVAAKVTKSVVSVMSEQTAVGPRTGGQELHPFFSDPFFEFFFGRPPGPTPRSPGRPKQSLGSGVIVSSDGIVITNHHVIEDADKIRVVLDDGQEFEAKVVGTDPKSDLAVLRVNAKQPLPAIEMADSQKLRTGDLVLAVGNPFGLGQTVTMGIVSAVGRANMGITDYEDFIQTDAAINPGNSGGALVTMDGRLAGINTAIISRSGGYQGIGFAIPSRMAMQIKDAILRDGRVIRGYLGVVIQDLTRDLAKAMGVEPNAGVLVADVSSDSPAARAGMKRGDVITAFDKVKPTNSAHLRRLVAEAGKDKKVPVEVLRNGKTLTIEVKLGEQPDELASAGTPKQDDGALAGVELRELDASSRRMLGVPNDVRGVQVTQVTPNTPAAFAGLRPGDIIMEVNRVPTPDLNALRAALSKRKDGTLLLIYRDGVSLFMMISG